MKSVLIAGSIRSGKSSICKMLYKELRYSIIESDSLVSTFQKAYPQLNISHKKPSETKQYYFMFIIRFLKEILKTFDFSEIPTAVCGEQFLPELLNGFEVEIVLKNIE